MNNVVSGAGIHDFVFQTGEWRVKHRKLKQRPAGETAWYEFDGRCTAWELMGGEANVDEHSLDDPNGAYRSASLRRYDAETRAWSIWWWDSRTSDIGPPVHGRFENGVGKFFGDDYLEGHPIKVRYIWSKVTTTSAQWEQAFSPDEGVSWETNWIMVFERA
jgi:hypothetical protein